MRELEGQSESDVSREVAGTRAGNTGLFLVRPREMTAKTKKGMMFFIVAVRCNGSRQVANRVKSCCSRSVFYTSPSLPLLMH